MKLKALLLFAVLSTGPLHAATLSVGPGQPYASPCLAIAAAATGDTILIDAAGGPYNGDVCSWSKNRLTLRGVNGRPVIDARGKSASSKGTWVIDGNDNIIDNIEFTGAAVPDKNGAGIRFGGRNLTIRRCYFHHNQNGLLTNNMAYGEILIEFSEFAHNGAGDGLSHNMYIGHVDKFILLFSYSHDTVEGHLVKTRAAENYILYNRITGENGTTSYNIDIPNGGLSYVIGNVIEQGPNESNNTILTYMGERAHSLNPSWDLFVINNTFVNSQPEGMFIRIHQSNTTPAVILNNILAGPGTMITQASAVTARNLISSDPLFVNPGAYDYNLRSGSPAINVGSAPGTGGGKPLSPEYEYVHPACGRERQTPGNIDVGAFAYSNFATPLPCGPATGPSGLSGISVNPATVTAGAAGKGAVLLDYPAPAGGITVAISSSNGPVASAPSTVVVPAGFTSTTFTITTGGVVASTNVILTATYSGASKTANLTVNPGVPTAQVTLSADTLDFGSQTVGSSTAAKTVTVSNTGIGSLAVSSIAVGGTNPADFTLTHTCGASLDAGSRCSISVTFKPDEAGSRSATIVLTDSASLSSQSIQLSGFGVGRSRATSGASAMVFSRQTVGTRSAAKSVTLGNLGAAPLNISSIGIIGAHAGDFEQTNDCPETLAVGMNCSISIVFTPSAPGTRSARVNIVTIGSASLNTVTLTGTGVTTPDVRRRLLAFPGR